MTEIAFPASRSALFSYVLRAAYSAWLANMASADENTGTAAADLNPLESLFNSILQYGGGIVNADDSRGYLADKISGGNNIDVAVTGTTGGRVVTLSSTFVAAPVGLTVWVAASTAPAGWLKCDGAAISRSTYADLFSAIGTAFGVGDGSTTFNIPDLRGEFLRGYDDGRGVDSGRSFGSAQADDFKSHQHTYGYGVHGGSNVWGGSGAWSACVGGGTTGATGGTETRPRNIALLPCIKY